MNLHTREHADGSASLGKAETIASDTPSSERIAIVGGGLAGSMLTLALAQKGYAVDLYERQPDPRTQGGRAGRSINLGLSKRGMQALEMVGLLQTVLDTAVVMSGRVIHAPDGSTRYQPYGKDASEVLHSIDRNELGHLLLDHAERHPQVRLHFGHRLAQVDKAARTVEFETAQGRVVAHPQWMVGADGAFSSARRELQRGERANYQQEYLEWGYKELTLAPGADGQSVIELTALHVWPRSHCLFVSHPNRDGSHTLTLFLPFEGEDSFATVRTPEEITALISKYFPDLVRLLPGLIEEWMKHPVGSLITTRTAPWTFGDWAVLVGDACHAVYPFYGQGMNSAFEDCCVLVSALGANPGDTAAAFHAYEQSRRQHTDVLCELSKENFVELRKKVQSPWFVARKRLDIALNRVWPKRWLPLYSMIAHTTMPYGEARARARQQDAILLRSAKALAAVAVCGVAAAAWWWLR
ncbi:MULTISPECIES: NAD(P)/FAD-dependent oxidoreductase [unclassified Lysobacter]|uniref:FAD-dependent oxidoreductase n=1 Tax=unclassified Lysobacter TaxID=2635362 RepID=UPI001BEA20BE|nr:MULTISPECIES: NAD(P)/FAD-dependent oxidoreductase [unclassified Lysobacter]MBT2745533.1 FAD-dependent monooxygenase [Lysobacter sp. ISL-42]MBT2753472.1 FAD-dependent monooxygenase [Lysobacter sp. ISL-50]MBT2777144.1 FAD-dependent monooxygenase [Lysobacter sp. ISL-54]MBT2780230.1 FAD-dependent monooxygenase [Lysobacter sp. ISL-52]